MKTIVYSTGVLVLVCLFNINVIAQADISSIDPMASSIQRQLETEGENETIDYDIEFNRVPGYFRHHKKLSSYFSGYAIELTRSDLPLKRNYILFERFGGIQVDRLKRGSFSYLITGFRNQKAAKKHLQKIVKPQAPESRIVQYVRGKRKV